MYILGINAYHGDSAACLIKDGIVICATEEERFRRVKHWAGFPSLSIRFCLEHSQISFHDIDYITISRDTKANFYKKLFYLFTNFQNIHRFFDRFSNSMKIHSIKNDLSELFNVSKSLISSKIFNIEHHRSHISSSFFASGFNDAALLSIDGFGDFSSTMSAYGLNNKFQVMEQINYPHSIGIFYTTLTQFLGFNNYGDEYKVMGLAPYGKPIYVKKLEETLFLTNDGFFRLNKKYFKHFKHGIKMVWNNGSPDISVNFTNALTELIGNPRNKEDKIEKKHINIAASVQKLTENVIFHILNELYNNTKSDNLCLSGGVAQNSVVNGKIISNTPFKNIYIPSAANDSGTSIGSALYLYNQILNKPRKKEIKRADFGIEYSQDEIITILDKKGVSYEILDDNSLFGRVVDNLLNSGVVGWFQGQAEFGSRALGNRSILLDPRRDDAKELLNKKIKRRESFRPFAPSILKEYTNEYFVENEDSYFMEKVLQIKKEKRSEIPAVTHVDGTGRLQTVDKNISPKYYNLIKTFFKRTGTPILLNTSFNENEPIVNCPNHALDCFLRTKMDLLVLGNILIERNND